MQRDAIAAPSALIQLQPRGPFSLTAAARFLAGFAPLTGTESRSNGHVHLAFPLDETDQTVGICMQENGDGLRIEFVGEAGPLVVRKQVARIFSLDVDGTEFEEVGRRDPVIAKLQERYHGLRPVAFSSPYEAGAWALISQRVQMTQAARIKARLAAELSEAVQIHGDTVRSFPTPVRLLELTSFRG